jgi:nicotinamidase-related amidase
MQRPHTARESHPVPAQRAGTDSGWAAATDDALGANAKTCSTCQRRVLTPVTVVKGCDTVEMKPDHQLFDRDRSCLLVIDVQQYFLDKLPEERRQPLVARIGWLMRVARVLDIPIIATAEDVANDGPLVADLIDELPEGWTVHDKTTFGLAGQPSIATDVERTGRPELVIVGLETDVCVAHSALGLMELGYRVAVIDDATASPAPHHDYGIQRLRSAGAVITSVKGIYYEWIRDLATMYRIRPHLPAELPPGLTL